MHSHSRPFQKLWSSPSPWNLPESLKYFLLRGRVFSDPHDILHLCKLKWKEQLKIFPMFVMYKLMTNQLAQSNTNATCTINCILCLLLDSLQGGHQLLNLSTGKWSLTIMSQSFLTPALIHAIEALATQDMHGLCLLSETGQVLYDSIWIAGVDYIGDKADKNENDEEEVDNNATKHR